MLGRIELTTVLPKAPLGSHQAPGRIRDQTRPRVSPLIFLSIGAVLGLLMTAFSLHRELSAVQILQKSISTKLTDSKTPR